MNRVRHVVLVILGGVIVLARPVRAHHSFAAYYLEDQTVSVEGDLVSLEYRSPHSWVHIAAKDLAGQVQHVAAEWVNPARLQREGVTESTLRPGDHVVLTGSPSRTPTEYRMHLKKIQRPLDGWMWSGGRATR
jgi:hypothetical protein